MSFSLQDIFTAVQPASFRGIPFFIPDTALEAGRRVQKIVFPGIDQPDWNDVGVDDGPISITGIMIGDDFVPQFQAMRQAVRTPGPAVLVHPFLGQLLVILTGRARLSITEREIRVVRLQMTVELYQPGAPAAVDTLGATDDAASAVDDAVGNMVALIMTPAALVAGAADVAGQVASYAAGAYQQAMAVDAALVAAVAAPIAAFGTLEGATLDSTWPATFIGLLAGPPAAAVDTSATLLPPAIGPGDIPPAGPTVDPRVSTAAMLVVATTFTGPPGPDPTGMLSLAVASYALTGAVSAASDIDYDSQQDAETWRGTLLAAIDQVAGSAVALATTYPAGAGAVWTSLTALRGAVAADINAQIGRLPAVQTFVLADTLPAWAVAQALAGDNPSNLLAMYSDLVTRNQVTNPALMGPGNIEALVQAAA